MTTLFLTPLIASAATGAAAALWCRGAIPLLATAYGSAAAFVLVRVVI
jgi:hypothetical protein